MDDLTLRLFEHGEELGPDAPLVYLAMPLSQLGGDKERCHVVRKVKHTEPDEHLLLAMAVDQSAHALVLMLTALVIAG